MDDKVAIVGVNYAQGDDLGLTRERLCFNAVRGLLDQLGIDRHAIDSFILASNDFLEGRTISNVFEDGPVGAYLKDETKVEMDGINAVVYGALRILEGNYDTALIIAHSLCGHQVSPYLQVQYSLDPTYDRQLGLLNELSGAALQAKAYLRRHGLDEGWLDRAAAWELSCGASNDKVTRKLEGVDEAKVSSSAYLYEPLRELHCYPPTDGVCAIVMASAGRARELTDRPVWIRGFGSSIDSYYFAGRDLAVSPSAGEAARRAYAMAGVDDPASRIDLAEVSGLFAYQAPLLAAAMGLAGEEEAPHRFASGEMGKDAPLSLNPSGGALSAHPVCATGAVRVAEAFRQLRGEAGAVQAGEPRLALAHGQDGLCLQQNTVVILGI
jgi:acetyl-CoA C-acetyltransferase